MPEQVSDPDYRGDAGPEVDGRRPLERRSVRDLHYDGVLVGPLRVESSEHILKIPELTEKDSVERVQIVLGYM